ncbi:hypothetical protein AB0876_33375 [Mycobacterium sp. NPDC049093]
MANLDHRHRNKAMWKALTAEDNIDRTRGVLVNSYERARSTLANRRADREAFENERFSEGRRGRLEILRTQKGYDSWKLNTGNFIRHVASALAEVNQIQKEHNRAESRTGAQHYRSLLRQLALAIDLHRTSRSDSGTGGDAHDRMLWGILDQLTVPDGPDHAETSLTEMLPRWRPPHET